MYVFNSQFSVFFSFLFLWLAFYFILFDVFLPKIPLFFLQIPLIFLQLNIQIFASKYHFKTTSFNFVKGKCSWFVRFWLNWWRFFFRALLCTFLKKSALLDLVAADIGMYIDRFISNLSIYFIYCIIYLVSSTTILDAITFWRPQVLTKFIIWRPLSIDWLINRLIEQLDC
jgi:hypothetical protein